MTVTQLITALQGLSGILPVVMGDFPDDVLSVEQISTVKNGVPTQAIRLNYGISVPPPIN